MRIRSSRNGSRLRLRRALLALARQQQQKYERGASRVGGACPMSRWRPSSATSIPRTPPQRAELGDGAAQPAAQP